MCNVLLFFSFMSIKASFLDATRHVQERVGFVKGSVMCQYIFVSSGLINLYYLTLASYHCSDT